MESALSALSNTRRNDEYRRGTRVDLNVTVARFLNGSHCVTTEPLWQWDKGQILVLE